MQDLPFWQARLGVHRVPSVVFLRGPGALPAVYDASNTRRLDIAKLVADNSWQVLLFIYCLAWLVQKQAQIGTLQCKLMQNKFGQLAHLMGSVSVRHNAMQILGKLGMAPSQDTKIHSQPSLMHNRSMHYLVAGVHACQLHCVRRCCRLPKFSAA